LNPSSKTASNLAALYMYMERYKDAVALSEKAAEAAVRDAPTEYRIWGNLGDAYWLAGAAPDRAKSAYERAIKIAEGIRDDKDESADLSSILAEYYAKLGEKDLAVERIESALRTDPESGSVRFQAGLVYAVLKQNARAIKELQVALVRGIAPDSIQHAPELKGLRESGALSSIPK
jgi:tetratricopeptide (TPR) repeat protein